MAGVSRIRALASNLIILPLGAMFIALTMLAGRLRPKEPQKKDRAISKILVLLWPHSFIIFLLLTCVVLPTVLVLYNVNMMIVSSAYIAIGFAWTALEQYEGDLRADAIWWIGATFLHGILFSIPFFLIYLPSVMVRFVLS